MPNTTFKELSEEVKVKMLAFLETKEVMECISKTKAASNDDAGTFEMIISVEEEDRQGEVLVQEGISKDNYLNNSIVLWGHDYKGLPIGITDKIWIETFNGKKVTMASGRFAPADANPFAQQVRKLYDLEIQKAASVGFISKKIEGNRITQSELLEWSFVPVPAVANALSARRAKELGLDLELLKTKGIEFDVKEGLVVDNNQVEDEEQKGVVQDRIEARQNLTEEDWDKKYENMSKVYGIVYALDSVYFMPEVKTDQFDELLKESTSLLLGLLNGESAEKGLISKELEKGFDKKAFESFREKVGKVLSKKNEDLITDSIDQLEKTIAALNSLLDANGQGDEEEKALPKERSSTLELKEKKEINSFLLLKEVLRNVNNITSDALRESKLVRINKN